MAKFERTPADLTLQLAIGIVITMNLVLDKMSRLVVPKAIRDRFALAPGHELEVVVESDGFRLRPVHPASPLTSKDGLLICTSELPPTAWDVGAFLDKEREQRSRQVGGM
jgi:AbrB family looped-hinge helix DNA binding protein